MNNAEYLRCELKKAHNKLASYLDGNLVARQYRDFKRQLNGFIGNAQLENANSPYELFDLMETNGMISPGKYDELTDRLETIEAINIIDGITEIANSAKDLCEQITLQQGESVDALQLQEGRGTVRRKRKIESEPTVTLKFMKGSSSSEEICKIIQNTITAEILMSPDKSKAFQDGICSMHAFLDELKSGSILLHLKFFTIYGLMYFKKSIADGRMSDMLHCLFSRWEVDKIFHQHEISLHIQINNKELLKAEHIHRENIPRSVLEKQVRAYPWEKLGGLESGTSWKIFKPVMKWSRDITRREASIPSLRKRSAFKWPYASYELSINIPSNLDTDNPDVIISDWDIDAEIYKYNSAGSSEKDASLRIASIYATDVDIYLLPKLLASLPGKPTVSTGISGTNVYEAGLPTLRPVHYEGFQGVTVPKEIAHTVTQSHTDDVKCSLFDTLCILTHRRDVRVNKAEDIFIIGFYITSDYRESSNTQGLGINKVELAESVLENESEPMDVPGACDIVWKTAPIIADATTKETLVELVQKLEHLFEADQVLTEPYAGLKPRSEFEETYLAYLGITERAITFIDKDSIQHFGTVLEAITELPEEQFALFQGEVRRLLSLSVDKC